MAFQSIGEFYAAVTRRRLQTPIDAANQARDWMTLFPIVDPTGADAHAALAVASTGRLSYWDALLLATLGRAGCTLVLSEDMHDGAALAGVTARNPFHSDRLPEPIARVLD